MKAFAFALLLVVSVAYAADDPPPPAPPAPPEEPKMRIFAIPPAPPNMKPPDLRIPPPPHVTTMPRYWICPKDETMLRVVTANHKGAFECPVDGTAMKPAVGRSSAIFLLHEEPKP